MRRDGAQRADLLDKAALVGHFEHLLERLLI